MLRVSKMRGLQATRVSKLYAKYAVTARIPESRQFVASNLGSRQMHIARNAFVELGCTYSPQRTDQRKRIPLVYTQRADGRSYFYQIQRTRSFSTRKSYDDAFSTARDNPAKFWGEAAQNIVWFEPWNQTLDKTDIVLPKWFIGGSLNVCYNAVDRHVNSGRGNQPAIIYDSPVTNSKCILTYKHLQEEVSRLAGVLVRNGVKKGDLVVIYMPMVPQAMFTMLACARIGATHSLIFGGFASRELSVRIDHAKPKMIVTASFGIEPGRRVEYIPLVEKALELSSHKPQKVLIFSRPNMERVSMRSELSQSLDWEEEMAKAQPHDCVPLPANHPLYVLYTSGTTGTPKGIVRDTAGYAVMLNWTMSNVYGLSPGEVWWAASDLGWVVGHSYICYAPLLHGNTTILYEGKPVGTPDPGAFFRVLSEHGASSMFTAPTAIRAIRQQDPQAAKGRQYPLHRLRSLFVAGERCDVETLEWAKKSFNVPVLDHWWQTGLDAVVSVLALFFCFALKQHIAFDAPQSGLSLPLPLPLPLSPLPLPIPVPLPLPILYLCLCLYLYLRSLCLYLYLRSLCLYLYLHYFCLYLCLYLYLHYLCLYLYLRCLYLCLCLCLYLYLCLYLRCLCLYLYLRCLCLYLYLRYLYLRCLCLYLYLRYFCLYLCLYLYLHYLCLYLYLHYLCLYVYLRCLCLSLYLYLYLYLHCLCLCLLIYLCCCLCLCLYLYLCFCSLCCRCE
ncbi:hypothetical protein ACEWY4_002083 [Coilia grayii]|uniref:Acyl-CoA synthetase short-chain family member 3, mitochondrial n=1 Tax=Coilia grayii TaxID=363190 RepID=A0ABD1KUT5_9TELE